MNLVVDTKKQYMSMMVRSSIHHLNTNTYLTQFHCILYRTEPNNNVQLEVTDLENKDTAKHHLHDY